MSEPLIFAVGCIGAMAPEIVRLYKSRTKPLPPFPRSYYLISILFALLGGFVALILPATTLWGAFYAGVAFPTLLSSIAGKKPAALTPPEEQRKTVVSKEATSGEEKEAKLFEKPPEFQRMTIREFLGILLL